MWVILFKIKLLSVICYQKYVKTGFWTTGMNRQNGGEKQICVQIYEIIEMVKK